MKNFTFKWRHSLLIVCLALVNVVAVAQGARVSVHLSKGSLTELFSAIEKQTAYRFAYRDALVAAQKPITLSMDDAEVSAVLAAAFTGTPLEYRIVSETSIVVSEKRAVATNAAELIPVSGTVLDNFGQPIIGAIVSAAGKSVSTDVSGRFALQAVKGGKLRIAYLGFVTQEVPVTGALVKVTLIEDAQAIGEVVVVGYGVQNRRDVSTAIVSVKADQLQDLAISDFRQGLSGKMAGVQVIQSSGSPEGDVSIRIRGVSTVTAGSEPLYVIDGVPVERGLANLNTNDVESVEVLKDASSAAIYGSRGSNGVVLITTKRGKSDKLSVSYDGYYGIQNVSKKISMMDAYQFAAAAKDGHDNAYLDANPGGSPSDPNSIRPNSWERIPTELFPYLEGTAGLTNVDWQDEIFRLGHITSHNLSFQGKGKNVNYFISAGYLNNEGIVINSAYEKYSARFNIDGKSNNGKFKFGVNFAPSYSRSNRVNASGVNGVVQSALMMPPVWSVYNEDGSYNYNGNGYWRIGTDYQHNAVLNPVAQANLISDVTDRVSMTGRLFMGYEFIPGLTFTTSLGGEYYGAMNNLYRSKELPNLGHTFLNKESNGEAYSSASFMYSWLWENQLNYVATFKEAHNLSATLVQSVQMETTKSNNVSATLFPNDYIHTIGAGTIEKGGSNTNQWSLASYLARVQYNYKGRYLVSAALRADGSSRFGNNNRWGFFPSASLAWRISNEPFFKSQAFEDFKIRGSYGVTGNFNIGNYDYIATMSPDNYVTGSGSNSGLQSGYKPDKIRNNDLRWERTTMFNVGLDLLLWKGYLGFSTDFYTSNTTDMLLVVPVPHLTGYSTTLMNVGEVNNRGYELQLSSQQNYANGWNYSFNANFSQNFNTVLALGPQNTPLISVGSVNHATYKTEVGGSIGSYYLLIQDGIFANKEQLKQYPHFDNTRTGDFRFVDVDGDGVMDLDLDRAIVGNYMPKFTYGFAGSVGWKGIDFSFNFQGVEGNKILNLNQRYINGQEGNVNGMTDGLNRWRSESEPGSGQMNRGNRKSTGYNGRTSTFHLEDGSYLRLQNVALGYTLPQEITRKFFVQKLRFYVTGQNLITWTNYSGYNPEVSARPASATTPGEDYGTYPLARIISCGLNITF